LALHGEPQALRQRPIHNSVDRGGAYALVCYNAPPHLTVHRLQPDGQLGSPIEQAATLDLGVFPHQILTLPSNRAVSLVARGNNPTASKPGDPGAIKLFRFHEGRLAPMADIRVGGRDGQGYGPRHLDFHPSKPWAYVLVELQNQLHMHRLDDDLIEAEPAFIKPSTRHAPLPNVRQVAGAVHVHPAGHTVYVTNRISATTHPNGPFPFEAGENNIAVFALDPVTGEPEPIQFVDPEGFHVRAFTIDPTGRLLIAATLAPMEHREDGRTQLVSAGLSLFRIQPDGRLKFARKYDLNLAPGVQQMWVRAVAVPG
jgi:6-phosphogluconolactonase (cycloisomerase 2 family)